MKQYKELLEHILKQGSSKSDRTGVGTISTFGYQTRYNLQEGFPLVTLKRTPFRLIAEELLWFVSGSDKLRPLLEKNVHIWDEWAFKPWIESEEYKAEGRPHLNGLGALVTDEDKAIYDNELKSFCNRILTDDAFNEKWGCLNRVYGKQWRSWETTTIENVDIQLSEDVDAAETESYNLKVNYKLTAVDQLQDVINRIKKNPSDRRLIVSAWNPSDIPNMALPPCHAFFQFYVNDGKLSCQLYQRSADSFLGVPFNIASYALLTHMVAHVCGLEVGEFIHTFGDLHLYNNQLEATEELLKREPLPLPQLKIKRKIESIDDFTIDDFELIGYQSHPAIKVEVAV